MILTVGNTKGGVGKTLLALNMAIGNSIAGRRVLLVDGDRQGTAATAMAFRAQSGRSPQFECVHIPEGKALHAEVTRRRHEFDDVVIDAGGRDSAALRAALVLSDVLVIPFAPRSLDLWAMQDVAALVDEARAINPPLRALAVLNGADVAGTDNEDAARAVVAGYPQLAYVPAVVRRRKAFANAAGMGLSVLESKPTDPKAVAELTALANAIAISL